MKTLIITVKNNEIFYGKEYMGGWKANADGLLEANILNKYNNYGNFDNYNNFTKTAFFWKILKKERILLS